jgi:hypothetical protein
MNAAPIDYIRSLVLDISVLNSALDQSLLRWGADIPTVVLGDAIAEHLAVLPIPVRKRIFTAIEEVMLGDDVYLSTVMATGLVEALVSCADKKPELWKEYEKLLGAASMKHALAWRDFGADFP